MLISGMTISNLVDTGGSPGRRVRLLLVGLSLDFRAAYSTFSRPVRHDTHQVLHLRINLRIHPIPKLTSRMPLPVVATLMPLRFCRTMAANNRCASGCRAALPKLLLFINPNQILSWLTTRDSGAGYSPAIAAFQLLRPNRFSAPFGTSCLAVCLPQWREK